MPLAKSDRPRYGLRAFFLVLSFAAVSFGLLAQQQRLRAQQDQIESLQSQILRSEQNLRGLEGQLKQLRREHTRLKQIVQDPPVRMMPLAARQ